jgi:CelD/BcsL family acetyltransferase involved in cellulose biosynthesis
MLVDSQGSEPIECVRMNDVGQQHRVEVVTELSALATVEAGWRRIAESRGNAFITPEWFFAWYEHYGEVVIPCVPIVKSADGRRLQGLLPLVAERRGHMRSLRFAGSNVGDYFHPVAHAGEDDQVTEALAQALAARDEWRLALFDNVDVAATWPATLVASSPTALRASRGPTSILPYADIRGGSWDVYLAGRSSNLRSELGRKLRRLQREHEVRFRRTLDPGELESDIRTFFALHDRRWAYRGGSSSASERVRAFHKDFATQALARGWLRLWFLEVDGEPAASWYGWRIGLCYSYYLSGFDPEWSQHSVGTLLLAHTIQEAIAEGAAEYDLLLGDEAYKTRFATAQRVVRTIALAPSLHPVRLALTVDLGLRRAVRRLPPRGRSTLRKLAGGALRALPTSRVR